LDEDGLLYLVDRIKDMIVTGGENVYSTEVEQALLKHPGVRLAAAVGIPDEKWGEKVVAVVVPAAGCEVSATDLIAHCRELIAGYKIPREIAFADTLPITPSGKVLKRLVREQFSSSWAGRAPSRR
jgi:acyl-CoA synthetase (AMP-forming)/AMP-acid ligase II